MAGVVSLWNNWEVQVLVLVSFLLQVLLLLFARMRWRNISFVARTLLWLAYLLADSIAIYILGHMSFISKSHQHQQLMAFWAPFLLVHLGGQDTITAYSIEDNHLWPRHLLSLVVQALGVAYVLYKYTAGSGTLLTATALIFVAGVLKYGERVWALKCSNLSSISKFLDEVERPRVLFEAEREGERPYCPRAQWVEQEGLDSEEVLQGAHDLFPICMGQFADYKFWPSQLQSKAINLFAEKGHMYELIEMQLSLMYDVLYTKAAVIHTRCGCFIRAISLVATIATFFLFQSWTGTSDFNIIDGVVTYILTGGALLLEMTALLSAMSSTWACALLRARRWDRLHSIAISIRRWLKAAERNRRWSGSIGQYKLANLSHRRRDSPGRIRKIADLFGCEYLWKKLHPSLTLISESTKELVLKEILRIVEACEGNEEIMRSYNGQCALKPYAAFFEDPTSSTGIDFDEKVLSWHFATEIFISSSSTVQAGQQHAVVQAIGALSNYMMSLFVERPYMLPGPVRPRLYANNEAVYVGIGLSGLKIIMGRIRRTGELIRRRSELGSVAPPALACGVELATELLDKEHHMPEVLQVVLGVWVELLCYGAHHCSRESHARQLNSGVEFITVVWLLTTAMFNRRYSDEQQV